MKKNKRKYKKRCEYCFADYSAAMPNGRFCSDRHRVYYFLEKKCHAEIYEAQIPMLLLTVKKVFDDLNNKPEIGQADLDSANNVIMNVNKKLDEIRVTLKSLKTDEKEININNYTSVAEYMSIAPSQRTEAFNGLVK